MMAEFYCIALESNSVDKLKVIASFNRVLEEMLIYDREVSTSHFFSPVSFPSPFPLLLFSTLLRIPFTMAGTAYQKYLAVDLARFALKGGEI